MCGWSVGAGSAGGDLGDAAVVVAQHDLGVRVEGDPPGVRLDHPDPAVGAVSGGDGDAAARGHVADLLHRVAVDVVVPGLQVVPTGVVEVDGLHQRGVGGPLDRGARAGDP